MLTSEAIAMLSQISESIRNINLPMELTECNAFVHLLNSTSTITSMATKAITTMSATTTAMV